MKAISRIKIFIYLLVSLYILGSLPSILAQDEIDSVSSTAEVEVVHPSTPENIADVQLLMLSEGSDCELPCFWSFRPDITTINEIAAFIIPSLEPVPSLEPDSDFSGREGQYGKGYFFFEGDAENPTISIEFRMDGDILTAIQASMSNPSIWMPEDTLDLRGLLNRLESKPEIYITINSTTESFSFILIYNEVGVLAGYTFDFQEDEFLLGDTPIELCPRLEQNRLISLWLQSEDSEDSLGDRISLDTFRDSKHYFAIEEISNIDTDFFIEQVITNPDTCIEILSYLELLDRDFGL